ncbi:unnamed protein product, partial [Owenia fusiformis]
HLKREAVSKMFFGLIYLNVWMLLIMGINSDRQPLEKCDGTLVNYESNNEICLHSASSCMGRCGSYTNDTEMTFTCSCDSKCTLYKDCCDDFTHECPDESKRANEDEIHPKCTETKGNFGSVFQILDCPSDYLDISIKIKCLLNKQKKFGISSIPVVDPTTDFHYGNVFCAICNGVNPAQTVAWEVQISCPKFKIFNCWNNMAEILTLLQNDVQTGSNMADINIEYNPYVVPESPPRICAVTVDYCTGKCHNDTIVNMCVKTKGAIVHDIHMIPYKNLYCAICSSDRMIRAGGMILCGYKAPLKILNFIQYSVKVLFDFNRDGTDAYATTLIPMLGYMNQDPIMYTCRVNDKCVIEDCDSTSATVSQNRSVCIHQNTWVVEVHVKVIKPEQSLRDNMILVIQQSLMNSVLNGTGTITFRTRPRYQEDMQLSMAFIFEKHFSQNQIKRLINETFSNLENLNCTIQNVKFHDGKDENQTTLENKTKFENKLKSNEQNMASGTLDQNRVNGGRIYIVVIVWSFIYFAPYG